MRKPTPTPKKSTAGMKTADRTASQKSAALSKLGRKLSGRGAGSADAQASRGKAAERQLRNAVATSKNAGQRRAAPKKAAKVPRSAMRKNNMDY